MEDDLNEWFIHHILIHERALTRFFLRAWPDRSEVKDLCHEAYVHVYESAQKSRPTSPRGFLFTTARHLVLDRVRHGKVVSIEFQGDIQDLNVLIDDLSPERRVGARQELWRLAQAFRALPPKVRQIMWMFRVEERSQSEIAEHLRLTRKAVERRVAQGMCLLHQAYLTGERVGLAQGEAFKEGKAEKPDHG